MSLAPEIGDKSLRFTAPVQNGIVTMFYDVFNERSILLDIGDVRSQTLVAYMAQLDTYARTLEKQKNQTNVILGQVTVRDDQIGPTNVLQLFMQHVLNLPNGLTKRNSTDKLIRIIITGQLVRLQLDPGNEVTIYYDRQRRGFVATAISQGQPIEQSSEANLNSALYRNDHIVPLITAYFLLNLPNTVINIIM